MCTFEHQGLDTYALLLTATHLPEKALQHPCALTLPPLLLTTDGSTPAK